MAEISPILSSEEESDQMQTAMQNKSQPQPAVEPQPPPSPSPSSSEESDSDSDSDGPSSNVRPVATKRMREAIDTSEKKKKRSRLWSEEDVIALLKGLISYSAKYKCDPISDMNGFYDFIRNTLPRHIAKHQLSNKVRELKRKYEDNRSRGKEFAGMREFLPRHAMRVYDLSNEIWKDVKSETSRRRIIRKPSSEAVNAKGDAVKSGEVKGVKVDGGGGMEEMMLLNGRKMYELGEGVEGGKEWEKLKVEELELYQKLLELRLPQTKLVLKNIRSRVAD